MKEIAIGSYVPDRKKVLKSWSVGHLKKWSLVKMSSLEVIAPYMRGKDARDLDQLVDGVFLNSSNYKMQGQLFWVSLAAAEFAILDLLGKTAKRSAAYLLGGQRKKQINLYVANNHRSKNTQESLHRIIESSKGINAKALKFKIGGRMKKIDEVPGRTKKLIPMVAEALGDKCTLYADANGSYLSVQRPLKSGKYWKQMESHSTRNPCHSIILKKRNKLLMH